ncbi:MAG: hypothetical protein HC927_13050 [Deltaproteobacteria bacterium]|nr:hypothetical protein [Deltaproteobacteria bacterium]
MAAAFALVVIVRRLRGHAFNPYFVPVIVATGWLGSWLHEQERAAMIWSVTGVAILAWIATQAKAKPESQGEAPPKHRPWAYGPIGRTVVMLVAVYHLVAVASTQIPDKFSWSTFHKPADETFKLWLSTTQTGQGWGMFAPNPPRRNVFMRVTVTTKAGETFDLNTDVYACLMPDATEESATRSIPCLGSGTRASAR